MGAGVFKSYELEELSKNPNVEMVNGNRIKYTESFKLLFIEEYFEKGKTPLQIFEEAGFSQKLLGSKRIERASARWREANAAGLLGEPHEKNNTYTKRENQVNQLKKTIKEKDKEIKRLKKIIKEYQEKYDITSSE